MVNPHVMRYVNIMKQDWSVVLAKHGFSQIEEDITDDGQWHSSAQNQNRFKPLGRVAFWKRRSLDGVVIGHVKFYDLHRTSHGNGAYMVGNAPNYFNRLNYPLANLETEFVEMNGRVLHAIHVASSCDFYDFLKTGKLPQREQKQTLAQKVKRLLGFSNP